MAAEYVQPVPWVLTPGTNGRRKFVQTVRGHQNVNGKLAA